jgi:hypothetical protein
MYTTGGKHKRLGGGEKGQKLSIKEKKKKESVIYRTYISSILGFLIVVIILRK